MPWRCFRDFMVYIKYTLIFEGKSAPHNTLFLTVAIRFRLIKKLF
jgi:hypothetical protein